MVNTLTATYKGTNYLLHGIYYGSINIISPFILNVLHFHRQSSGMRLWATMVLHLVGKFTWQGWGKNVEEAHRVHHAQRTPRVLCSKYTTGQNGLRWEKRWTNLVDWPRLRRYDAAISNDRHYDALTAILDHATLGHFSYQWCEFMIREHEHLLPATLVYFIFVP